MTQWPGITRAALEIAYDNGGVNRLRSEDQVRREIAAWLARQPADVLPAIDAWLSSLSDAELSDFCAGGDDRSQELAAAAPPFTDQLLNQYFDEVC